MSLMAVFFLVLTIVPIAWWVSRQFDDTAPILITWSIAALIVVGSLISFVLRTVDEGTGGEDGWGQQYRDIAEGKH